MPLPLDGLATRVLRALTVDQTGHRPHPRTMVLPMMTIRLAQGLIAPHPSNTMFDHNPSPRERPIEGDILRRTIFTTRFAARRRAQPLRMQFVNPNIGQ